MPSPHRPASRLSRRLIAALAAGLVVAPLLSSQVASAAGTQTVTVSAVQAFYPVDEGGTARFTVAVSTDDNKPLAEAASLTYRTGAGTATPGADYTPVSGAITFAKGSIPGTHQTVTVAVRRDRVAETAETVPLELTGQSAGLSVGGQPTAVINANGLPYLDRRLSVERRVSDLMARMSLDDKIGQMTQAERAAVVGDPNRVAQWKLGSVLSGGGSVPTPNTPATWVGMVTTLQQAAMSTPLQIPMIYGIDAVHGHGNMNGATIFPHNIGLGATRDPRLVEQTYHATADEVRATGIAWDFAPCVCVSRDERWGRSYESFGEDPALVTRMETAIDGLQGRRRDQLADPDRVLATVKHYAGDGDTKYGTGSGNYTIDQGVTVTSRADFNTIDLPPYAAAVRDHHAGSVMPSFSSVDFTDDGIGNPVKMHANQELITRTLKNKLGFAGFVVSDWQAIHQIPDPSVPASAPRPTAAQVRIGVNAGTDMFMEPNTAPQFEAVLKAEVTAGRVSTTRIDDAVRRILRTKMQLGLFEHPYPATDRIGEVGSTAHRALARKAVAQSQVLLKNTGNLLPLAGNAKLYVAGRNANDIGNQAGGWTIDWQGRSGASIPGTTILDGIRQVAPHAQVTYSPDGSAPTGGAQVGVVVVGETPYAEGLGDVGAPACTWCTPPQAEPKSLTLQPADRAVIDNVCTALPKCVVLVVSGRPQIIGDQLASIDALVASWLPGSEGAGVADVLFGRTPFTGRLPVSWPRTADQVPTNVGDTTYQPLYPYGWGLRTDSGRSRLTTAAGTHPSAATRALLAIHNWRPDGTLKPEARTLHLAAQALISSREPGVRDAVLSITRDAAQQQQLTGRARSDAPALLADADHAQATGVDTRAFQLLSTAIKG